MVGCCIDNPQVFTAGSPVPPADGGTGTPTIFTAGSVVFAGAAGVYQQDNANFFYNTGRLGVGENTKLSTLTVKSPADISNIGGTTTANASTTITGVGTTFTTSLGLGDRISLSSSAATYATVMAIASDTSLTTDIVLGDGTSQTINKKSSLFRLDNSAGTPQVVTSDQGFMGLQGMVNPMAPLSIASGSSAIQIHNTASPTTTNYERGSMFWSGNILKMGFEAGGTGSSRSVQIGAFAGSGSVSIVQNGTASGLFSNGNIVLTPRASTSSGGPTSAFQIIGPASTGQTASTELIDNYFNNNRTVQFATGSITTNRSAVFEFPTYAFVGASTITNAATLAITGAPAQGTNATITNAYALWVQGGGTRLDGKITNYGSVVTAGNGVPSILGYQRATGQTAAVTLSSGAYTVGVADGSFDICANVLVTTATTHAFTVTCAYTDEGNTSRVLTLQFSNLAGTFLTSIANAAGAVPYEGVAVSIRAKAGTTITIASAAGGVYTSVVYNIEGFITWKA